jgi:predicted anti-sigma-YlaC factor YlaD
VHHNGERGGFAVWFLASCEHVQERLSALDDGELGRIESLRVRGHLAMCRACARVRRGLRVTRDALELLRDDAA